MLKAGALTSQGEILMSDLKTRFGKRLRYLRRQRDMTQEQLAENAEISVDFAGLMERGVNAPSFNTLEKLARALDLEVHDLFDFGRVSPS